jgi:hypothetical protein
MTDSRAEPSAAVPSTGSSADGSSRGVLGRIVDRLAVAFSGLVAVVSGVLPHVLHHVGPLAGAAIVSGAGGSLLFGVLGLLVSIPFLLRLRRRSGGWALPAAATVLFVLVFTVSTLFVGPALTDGGEAGERPRPEPPPAEHDGHHP